MAKRLAHHALDSVAVHRPRRYAAGNRHTEAGVCLGVIASPSEEHGEVLVGESLGAAENLPEGP